MKHNLYTLMADEAINIPISENRFMSDVSVLLLVYAVLSNTSDSTSCHECKNV